MFSKKNFKNKSHDKVCNKEKCDLCDRILLSNDSMKVSKDFIPYLCLKNLESEAIVESCKICDKDFNDLLCFKGK